MTVDNSQSKEQYTPELQQKIWERWGIVSRGSDNVERITLPETIETKPHPEPVAVPQNFADNVIGMAAYRERKEQESQQQMISQSLQAIEEIHESAA